MKTNTPDHEKMLKISRIKIFIILLPLVSMWNCSSGGLRVPVQEVDDPEHGLQSHIMTSNYIKQDSSAGGYSYWQINPGRIKPKNNQVYYVFNLIYHGSYATENFDTQNRMLIEFDNDSLELEPHDIKYTDDEVVAFYEIDKFDLLDLANAKSIKIMIGAGNPILSGGFSEQNIYNLRYFTSRYVLNSSFEPEPPQPIRKDHWGFTGVGVGSGYEFWLAKYSNLFTRSAENRNCDFLALGFGFSPFSYQIKGIRQIMVPDPENPPDSMFVIRYWLDEEINRYIPAPGVIYGWSFKNVVSNISLEAGVSARYHFLPAWQGQSDSVYVPEKDATYPSQIYVHSKGKLFDGFSIGLYLQLGGIWARVDSERSWAAGISLPVPWWK